MQPVTVGDDLLEGAEAIGAFLFGPGAKARRAFYLIEKSMIPHFRIGKRIMARKSTLLRWLAEQERGGGANATGAN
jgi:hypothetical protein